MPVEGLTNYYYTIRVQETSNAANGTNTDKATTQTLSASTAPGTVTNPSVAIPTAKDRFTITATPPDNRGMQADGTTDVNENNIKYELYYALDGYNGIGASSIAADIATVIGAVPNNDTGKIAINRAIRH